MNYHSWPVSAPKSLSMPVKSGKRHSASVLLLPGGLSVSYASTVNFIKCDPEYVYWEIPLKNPRMSFNDKIRCSSLDLKTLHGLFASLAFVTLRACCGLVRLLQIHVLKPSTVFGGRASKEIVRLVGT